MLTLSHLKETIREPEVLFWGIIFPMLMALGLGFAFTKKTDTLRKIGVVNESLKEARTNDNFFLTDPLIKSKAFVLSSADSSHYKYTIENSKLGNSTFEFSETTWGEAIEQLKQGKVNLIIGKQNDSLRFYFDPANPDAQISYLKLSQLVSKENNTSSAGLEQISPLTVPGSRYIDFLIPGLIAMGVMMSTMWGLSYGLIEKRSKKLLRRMIATPMKKSHFIFSLLLVRLLMNIFEAVLLIVFARLVFHTKIQGSIPGLILIFLAGNIAFAGLAVIISSRTSKTEVGNGLVNVVVMPMMLLSGIFFSYHNFPDKFVAIIQKLPLTMVADGIRGIFIEGTGFNHIIMPSVILTVSGFLLFTLGVRMFKWY